MFSDMFKQMWWSMGVGTSFPLGELLQNSLGAASNVNSAFLNNPTFQTIYKSVTKLSYELVIFVGLLALCFSLVAGNTQVAKKFLKNMLIGALGITLLSFPIQLSGSLMNVLTPCQDGKCSSEIQSTFIVNLVNPYVFRVDETGQIIDSNGNVKGSDSFDEKKVHNVLTGNNADTDTLYTEDYKGCEGGESSCSNMTFNSKDVEELKQGDNYAFDVTMEGKINGVKFHYDYSSIFLMLLGNIVLFAMFGFGFVKMLIRVLNFIFTLVWSMIINVVAVFKGEGAYKELMSTIFKLIMGTELQFIYFTMLGSLMMVTIGATTQYGVSIMLLSLIALAIFMIDGPDQITKLMDVDLGATSPLQTYIAGKAAALGFKGVGKTGESIGNLPGFKGMREGIKTGSKEGAISKGISELNDKVARGGYNAAQKFTGGKGESGLSYDEYKKQQESKNNPSKNEGNQNSNNTPNRTQGDGKNLNNESNASDKSSDYNKDKRDIDTKGINPSDIIGDDIDKPDDVGGASEVFKENTDKQKATNFKPKENQQFKPASKEQIDFAKKLGIKNPEKYPIDQLSKKIDGAKQYQEGLKNKPSEAQIKTANNLGIENPESMTKSELSQEISQAKTNNINSVGTAHSSEPTQKHIDYASRIGVENPEQYKTKQDLNNQIDYTKAESVKMGKYNPPEYEKVNIPKESSEERKIKVNELDKMLGHERDEKGNIITK